MRGGAPADRGAHPAGRSLIPPRPGARRSRQDTLDGDAWATIGYHVHARPRSAPPRARDRWTLAGPPSLSAPDCAATS